MIFGILMGKQYDNMYVIVNVIICMLLFTLLVTSYLIRAVPIKQTWQPTRALLNLIHGWVSETHLQSENGKIATMGRHPISKCHPWVPCLFK